MNREDFLAALSERIQTMPTDEKNTVYEYYNEIILDKMDSGMDEAEVIAEFGDLDDIAAKILSEYAPEAEEPQSPPNSEYFYQQPMPPKRSAAAKVWIMIGLVLGSPIWLSLLLSFFAVIVSVVFTVIAVVICLWASAVAVTLSGLFVFAISFLVLPESIGAALFQMGLGLVVASLGAAWCIGMVALSRETMRFLKWMYQKFALLYRSRKQPLFH